MVADPQLDRFYRTRQQAIGGWILAFGVLGVSVGVLLLPAAGRHGGLVIAAIGVLAAIGLGRFASCGVRVTARGVHVTNMLGRKDLAWSEIEEFKLSPAGASQIKLRNGGWVLMIGIEQTNLAWLTNRKDTPERRMIAELNALLTEHR